MQKSARHLRVVILGQRIRRTLAQLQLCQLVVHSSHRNDDRRTTQLPIFTSEFLGDGKRRQQDKTTIETIVVYFTTRVIECVDVHSRRRRSGSVSSDQLASVTTGFGASMGAL